MLHILRQIARTGIKTEPKPSPAAEMVVVSRLQEHILRTLEKTGNNKTKAAELLKISLKTLHNKLNSYRAQGLMTKFPEK